MGTSRRLLVGIGLGTCLVMLSGCRIMHELQPHRLQRLNRGPDIGSGALYSVQDEIPTRTTADQVNHEPETSAR